MSTELSNKYAFAALRDNRAEIAGRIAALKKWIARHKLERASWRLFDSAYQIGDIPTSSGQICQPW